MVLPDLLLAGGEGLKVVQLTGKVTERLLMNQTNLSAILFQDPIFRVGLAGVISTGVLMVMPLAGYLLIPLPVHPAKQQDM